MSRRIIVIAMAIAVFVSVASADDAAQSFALGGKALAEGNLKEALKNYAQAVKQERANQEYRQQYMLVRRVAQIRKSLKNERNEDKWLYMALSLRSFYYANKIYSEALAIDREIHKRFDTVSSTALLAESLLATGNDQDAETLLEGVKKTTHVTQALLGIALARLKKSERAAKIAGGVKMGDDPYLCYQVARLYALLGDLEKACLALARCFESTLPSQLNAIKGLARDCRDFEIIAQAPEYLAVFETKSKVKESSCSGGKNCSSCPNRTGCGKCQGH